MFDFRAHLLRQRNFSERAFGPGRRTLGILEHIRKELKEIEEHPTDLSEWIDVAILALDGAWRAGHSPSEIIEALVKKQEKNEAREWPDWRQSNEDKAIEHRRVEVNWCGKFLEVRKELIREFRRDQKSCTEIAQILSMDPGQVWLIADEAGPPPDDAAREIIGTRNRGMAIFQNQMLVEFLKGLDLFPDQDARRQELFDSLKLMKQ